MLNERNYQRFHLLNSILILEQCDKRKQSVSLAIEILYSYINESELSDDHKLKYAFSIFRNVRTVSYMAYDLQIADTPLTIDICNEGAMLLILRELLSEYNNNQSSKRLVESITKLLDDTVYNENSNAICYYRISRRIVTLLSKEHDFSEKSYYNEYFINQQSVINNSYWLIATEELIRDRLNNSKAFAMASDKAKQNYLKRSIWHNKFLEEQCSLHNRKQIKICGNETVDEIAEKIIRETKIEFY